MNQPFIIPENIPYMNVFIHTFIWNMFLKYFLKDKN